MVLLATNNYNHDPNNGWQYRQREYSDIDAKCGILWFIGIFVIVFTMYILCISNETKEETDMREESVTMIELKGEDYIKFIEGLDNDKAIYELIKQAVIYNGLAQQEAVTEDDVFHYNAITNEVYKRMN